jgi:multidrug efflux pump
MRIAEYCIKNPVTAVVINLLFILIGTFSYHQLEVRIWPQTDIPMVKITTNYTGASAALIEQSVTNILEQQLASVPGIDDMSSESSQDTSSIKIHLLPDANADAVVSKIREVVSRAQQHLPNNVDTPTVIKGSSSGELAEYALLSNNTNLSNLKDYATLYLEPEFQAIDGISDIDIWGIGDHTMNININPQSMAANNISIADISSAVKNANVSLPGGMVRSYSMNYPVNIKTQMDSSDQYKNIVLSSHDNQIIHLGDVADIKLGTAEDATTAYVNNKPAIYLEVNPLPDANNITAYQNMKALVQRVQSTLPSGTTIVNTFDMIKYLLASIHEVYFSIFFAVACVLAVVYLFLGNIRAVLIPTIAIPISLIGAFFPMLLGGLSINLFTLMALVLAVGLVVDDAIVVLENIQRHQYLGQGKLQSAIDGGNEIQYAVIVMTLTLVAVYAPIATISGRFAAVYIQFAVTLTSAVLISGLVSLTLSPVMCAYFLQAKPSKLGNWSHLFFEKLADSYKKLLSKILQHRPWVLLLLAVLIGTGYFVYRKIPHEIMPKEDVGLLVTQVNLAQGSNINATHRITQQVADTLKQRYPDDVIMQMDGEESSNSGMVITVAQDTQKNNFLQELPQVKKLLNNIPGARINAVIPSLLSDSREAEIAFMLTTSDDFAALANVAAKIQNKLRNNPYMENVSTDLDFSSQEYNITVNHNLASSMGITNQAVNDTLNAVFGNNHVTNFNYKNQSFDVLIQTPPIFRNNIQALDKVMLPAANGKMVPLSQIVAVQSVLAQPVLKHYDRERAAEFSASLKANATLGAVANYLNTNLPQWLPANVGYHFTGQLRQLTKSSANMIFIFGMSLVIIYLLLAVQFGSFLDPLAVMFTVPLCIVGALFFLMVAGGSINLYTVIALVTLVGLITKHGILIVQFSKQKILEGLEIIPAVIEAAGVRMRPILMTTAAMLMGSLPLALAFGNGAVERRQIGITIIGGLICGTFFSLIVVPVVYSYLTAINKKFRARIDE